MSYIMSVGKQLGGTLLLFFKSETFYSSFALGKAGSDDKQERLKPENSS